MGAAASRPTAVTAKPAPVEPVSEKQSAALASTATSSPPLKSDAPSWASIPTATLGEWTTKLDQDPSLKLARLVLSHNDPLNSLLSREALIKDGKVFNLDLKGVGAKGEYPGPRVNQASSGRCWLFATTNVLRYNVIETLQLGEFQLSQSYLFFYDKLEKANYFLENALELADEPADGRLVAFLNEAPINDGGQWDMAVNILEKYGCIPHTLFPESWSSSASARINTILTAKVREFALTLRKAASSSSPSSLAALRSMKTEMLAQIHSALCITLGTPPRPDDKLTWDYYDKDNKYHQWTGTPLEFYDRFARRKGMDPKDSFSLINDPRNGYDKLFTVERLGNVWGGRPVRYVNQPITDLEDAVISAIKANTPIFFGCDVGKSSNSAQGVMDTDLFDLKLAFGFELEMTKAERLIMGESSMTHAMVITAVHLDDKGRPVRYKVENSWSDAAGEKGWFMMTSSWFKEYVYQVVVPRKLAKTEWTDVLDKGEATVLKPWDPMGTLA